MLPPRHQQQPCKYTSRMRRFVKRVVRGSDDNKISRPTKLPFDDDDQDALSSSTSSLSLPPTPLTTSVAAFETLGGVCIDREKSNLQHPQHEDDNSGSTSNSSSELTFTSSSTVSSHEDRGHGDDVDNYDHEIDALPHPNDVLDIKRLPMVPPSSSLYLECNHRMINVDRAKLGLPYLCRDRTLDDIARRHANELAKNTCPLRWPTIDDDDDDAHRRLGINVCRGSSTTIRKLHQHLCCCPSDRANILDGQYTHMGVGTAVSPDGIQYLCQIFGG